MPKLDTDFSESTFAFAFTDNLLRDPRFSATGAPRFLSTYAEGRGQHFDVELPAHPVAFFFQFKIPEVMQRRRRLRNGSRLPAPFYRMNLRTKDHFAQHRGLLACEADGRNIHYVSPRFHTHEELDVLFSRGEVHDHTAWFRPSHVTPPDYTRAHGVVYDQPGQHAEVRSPTPREHEGPFDFEAFLAKWTATVESAPRESSDAFLGELIKTLRRAEEIAQAELPRLRTESEKQLRPPDKEPSFLYAYRDERSPLLALPRGQQSPALEAVNLARSLFGLEILVGGRD